MAPHPLRQSPRRTCRVSCAPPTIVDNESSALSTSIGQCCRRTYTNTKYRALYFVGRRSDELGRHTVDRCFRHTLRWHGLERKQTTQIKESKKDYTFSAILSRLQHTTESTIMVLHMERGGFRGAAETCLVFCSSYSPVAHTVDQ